MFSNKPQPSLPKDYSFDIHVYSIRIPPTEAYQGQHFDFSKGVPSKTHKKMAAHGTLSAAFGTQNLFQSLSL